MSGSVQIPVDWFDRDDVEAIGAGAVLLHLSALAYSARQLTDGTVPRRQLRRLWDADDVGQAVSVLEKVGWWEPVDDGWVIRDWHDFILSASEVDKIRSDQRTRGERHRRHKRGDHSMCDYCWAIRSEAASRRDEHRDEHRDSHHQSPRESRPPNRTSPKVRGEEATGPAAFDGPAVPPARKPQPTGRPIGTRGNLDCPVCHGSGIEHDDDGNYTGRRCPECA